MPAPMKNSLLAAATIAAALFNVQSVQAATAAAQYLCRSRQSQSWTSKASKCSSI
jgi:hypothetical protein